jgi:hypothetical protein
VFRVNAGDVSTKSAGKYPERSFLPWIRRELFFRLKKSGGSPKQRHVGIAIAANATTDTPHGAIRVLDDLVTASEGETASCGSPRMFREPEFLDCDFPYMLMADGGNIVYTGPSKTAILQDMGVRSWHEPAGHSVIFIAEKPPFVLTEVGR